MGVETMVIFLLLRRLQLPSHTIHSLFPWLSTYPLICKVATYIYDRPDHVLLGI